jgi:hypothetical protein
MPQYWSDFVVPAMLAGPDDLASWTGQAAPENATPLLRSATLLVQEATAQAYYATDPVTGLATDAQTKQALNDATCIQAAAWAALGIDPLRGGVAEAGVESSTKIGTAAVAYADAEIAAQAEYAALTGLVPEAMRKLMANNLIVPQAWAFG